MTQQDTAQTVHLQRHHQQHTQLHSSPLLMLVQIRHFSTVKIHCMHIWLTLLQSLHWFLAQLQSSNCQFNLSPPIALRLYTLPYWSSPSFLIFDIRALWRSVLSIRATEYQKLKMVGQTSMTLNPLISSNLEQVALKGLIVLITAAHWVKGLYHIHKASNMWAKSYP